MHSAKQKVKDAAAVATEHAEILQAKYEEKAEKTMAKTETEKDIATERRKAKEAVAKMKMHEAKANHAEEKLIGKHHGTVTAATGLPGGAVAPTYPLAGRPAAPYK